MAKLFAFEEEKSTDNELIIDKLLEKGNEKPSPMSLTADLLKQRDQVNKDVEEHITKQEEENDEEEDDNESSDSKEDSSDDDKKDSGEEPEVKDDDKEESSDSDDLSAADDKDSLGDLIGSGLKDESDKEDSDKEEKKEEPAAESIRVTLKNIFSPIKIAHENYVDSLSIYNLSMEALPTEQQPVVYVKEAVIESIARLAKVANDYIDNTRSSVETYTASLLKLNERIAVFSKLVEAGKHQFTHKLVKDKDLLTAISFKGHSDPRETSRVLLKYLNDSNKAISVAVNNEFNELHGSFSGKEFIEEGTDLVYSKSLPGFLSVKVAIEPYINYIKTKIENYHYYAIKTLKLEDAYELTPISITEDKDIEYIVKTLNDLVISSGVSLDTLKAVTEHFTSFVNELKVLSYDVQNDKYANLAELGIDGNVQDFIKFKLAMEASLINITMSMNYISSMSSVMDICLELSE